MPLSKEQLMQERYEVIALYPDCSFNIGDIIVRHINIPNWFYLPRKDTAYAMNGLKECETKKHPHLFRPLEWWERRSIEDMPEYVFGLKSVKKVKAIEDHGGESLSILCEGEDVWGVIWMYVPATEQEYTDYLNSKK